MGFRLEYLESRLRALVEDHLGRVPWRGREEDWSRRLFEALQTALLNQPTGQPLPSLCVIEVSPSLYAAWHHQEAWQVPLVQALKDVASEAGFTFLGNPQIQLRACAELGEGEIRIRWGWGDEALGETAVLALSEPTQAREQPSKRAFLIVQGKDIFPLDESVISIGRHSDNLLVLPDLRVSRHHAQIRRVGERYVLFDLNSTGGTYVNGERVSRWELQPGDVISLAGVSLIYGEESRPDTAAETRPVDGQ
ncbi:FHA domain-containing protein [uncultured Thermanaerothrix sp.]|uniref:FHA domain-containing protein n=1 Tax=uncultured Thermanaerothrix sp. TaxID=1195149 RepID=UPI00262B9525|nr:FHA domain-containing protein [uncultured Thermanaerothrix sp.]